MRGSPSASHGQQHLESCQLDLAENIGLELTLPRLHWACISEPILTESWRCTCQGHLRSSTNSDLMAVLLLGVEIVIGVADEEVFAAAMDPRQLIMQDDKPESHHYRLYQYWASSFLADLADD